MRKLILIILTLCLTTGIGFAKDVTDNPLYGKRPWEQQLEKEKEIEKIEIKQECAEKQRRILLEEKKRKELEEKRKQEEQEEKLRQERQWEYFEEKDYAVDQSSSGEEKAAALIEYAKDHLGVRYTWGGESWSGGVDCSGFTKLCYAKFGVSLPHYSGAQENVGSPVDGLSNARPGDIICYPGHVALYIGDGQIIHASNYRTGVIIGSATYRAYTTIRRVFN